MTRDIGGSDPERMAAPKVLQYVQETFKDTCIKVKLMLTLNKMLSFSGQQVQLSRNLSLNLFVFVLKLMTNWYISTPLLAHLTRRVM